MDIGPESGNSIRTIVLGCGRIGSLWDEVQDFPNRPPLSHVGALLKSPQYHIVGLYDLDEERNRSAVAHWGLPSIHLHSMPALKIDLAVVATPAQGRRDVLRKLLDAKIPMIFCEKPLGHPLEEACIIIEEVSRSSTDLVVNFSRTFNPEIIRLGEEVKSGAYGLLQRGSAVYGKGLFNNGSHVISTIAAIFNQITTAKSRGFINDDRVEDPTLDFDLYVDDALIRVHGLDHRHYTLMEFDFLFEKGRIRISESGERIEIYKKVPDPKYPGYEVLALTETRIGNMTSNLMAAYSAIGKRISGETVRAVSQNKEITRSVNDILTKLTS